MHRRALVAATLAAAVVPAAAAAAPEPLDALLGPERDRAGLPALAAAVVRAGTVVAAGAVGVRRVGTSTPVALTDRFHLGSDTKAMTAALAGMMVDDGTLRWDSTVAESFPELAAGMDPGVRPVQLQQLLSHSGGIPPDDPAQLALLGGSYTGSDGNLDAMRLWIVQRLVRQPLASAPGARFAYANLGYVLAGAMLERAAASTYEEMLTTRLFAPLGLASAGFGPQASIGRVDATLGHAEQPDGTLRAMLGGPNGDNPVVLGPAGTAHMSVLDFAAWAAWNAGAGARQPVLLRPETWRRLHTPLIDLPARPGAAPGTPRAGGGYGFGWGTVHVPYAPDAALLHEGSNTLNLARIVLWPARDFGFVLMANAGGERAERAFDAVAPDLYARYAPA